MNGLLICPGYNPSWVYQGDCSHCGNTGSAHEEAILVTQLRAQCGVRYWEDATVDGVEDTDGSLIPLRKGDDWCPTINLATGKIEGWPEGVVAKTHYKVCDDGEYSLLFGGDVVRKIQGYAPQIMRPAGGKLRDYVVMEIGPDGKIKDWRPDIRLFSIES